MTTTHTIGLTALADLEVPTVDGYVDWEKVTSDELHAVIHNAVQLLNDREPHEPTEGVLERSVQLEETARAMVPLQHRYAGLLEDAFNSPKLRSTVDLPKGKTPFRDSKDFIAKTHGLRAFEAIGRLKLSRNLTPARASDPERREDLSVGDTQYPLLGALQAEGRLHPSKLSTAVNMLTELDDHATTAGKDHAFREDLQRLVERDLAEKIEYTTPEEFSRYVSRRKSDLIASMDPPDRQFTTTQTQAMHTLRCEGPVRGNPNATKWGLVADAELNEALHFIANLLNNPRAGNDANRESDAAEHKKETEESEPATRTGQDSEPDKVSDGRPRGQRAMHALRDALKFAIANLQHTKLPGTNGHHTKLVVIADYPTLVQHLRDQLGELLPEVDAPRREKLLELLAEVQLADEDRSPLADESGAGSQSDVLGDGAPGASDNSETEAERPGNNESAQVLELPTKISQDRKEFPPQDQGPPDKFRGRHRSAETTHVEEIRPAKTTNLKEILGDENLNRLQPRIGQGVYTSYYPPEILLRLLCDVSVSPVTLTGEREVLSIGREQRKFPGVMRRAIFARDRGCAVPGCHWPAAWCELHHIEYWSDNGATSIDNGLTLCSHHHQSIHAKVLTIERVGGEWHFIQHPLIDPTQQPRKNHFWQN